jgi:hypothetical protein
MLEKKDTLFVSCVCHGEGLIIEDESEEIDLSPRNIILKEVDISFWSREFNDPRKLNFKDKLRFVWKVVKTGRPYYDMVCLKEEEIIKVRDYLSSILEVKGE